MAEMASDRRVRCVPAHGRHRCQEQTFASQRVALELIPCELVADDLDEFLADCVVAVLGRVEGTHDPTEQESGVRAVHAGGDPVDPRVAGAQPVAASALLRTT